MKKCKCGSQNFSTICSMRVNLKLNNDVLTAVDKEDLGDDGIYCCNECDEEYQRKDFKEIVYS